MESKIKIDGLAQFNRALRKLDADTPKQLRIALNDSATLLIDRTRPVIRRLTGRAAGSLKAASTRTSAAVRVGGSRAPYYPWLDFGGRTGPRGSVVRPFYKEGRYLYPTLARIRPEIEANLARTLNDLARDSGLEVT